MRYAVLLSAALAIAVVPSGRASEAPSGGPAPASDDKRPLVMFIGDSVTVGTKSHPNAEKYPRWSYVEALRVLTDKHGPYRYDKRCGGGQSICGSYRGLYGMAKGVTLGVRNTKPPEGLAFIVFQDSAVGHMPAPEEYEPPLREIVGFAEQRPGVQLILSTTAFERRKEGNELSAAWNKINELVLKVAGEKKLGVIRQDIFWQRYIDWYTAKGLPAKEERKWRITGNEGVMDTVHPGATGAVFLAMVMARDLDVPADKLEVDSPDLPIPKEQAAEIRDFVYSWKEPTVLPPGDAENKEKTE
jgi:hypothetical protein